MASKFLNKVIVSLVAAGALLNAGKAFAGDGSETTKIDTGDGYSQKLDSCINEALGGVASKFTAGDGATIFTTNKGPFVENTGVDVVKDKGGLLIQAKGEKADFVVNVPDAKDLSQAEGWTASKSTNLESASRDVDATKTEGIKVIKSIRGCMKPS